MRAGRPHSEHGYDARVKWIVDVHHHQPTLAPDIRVPAGDGHCLGAMQRAVRVECQRAPEEVVRRIAVGERRDVDENQPLLAIADVGVATERMNGLLFVFRKRIANGHRHRGRQRDRRGEPGLHVRPLAARRDRSGGDPLGEVLVVDVRNVVDLEAFLAVRREEVLAAQLDRARVAVMVMRSLQLEIAGGVLS